MASGHLTGIGSKLWKSQKEAAAESPRVPLKTGMFSLPLDFYWTLSGELLNSVDVLPTSPVLVSVSALISWLGC